MDNQEMKERVEFLESVIERAMAHCIDRLVYAQSADRMGFEDKVIDKEMREIHRILREAKQS